MKQSVTHSVYTFGAPHAYRVVIDFDKARWLEGFFLFRSVTERYRFLDAKLPRAQHKTSVVFKHIVLAWSL